MNIENTKKRNLLIMHIIKPEEAYHNNDPIKWSKIIAQNYKSSEIIFLQDELYKCSSWGKLIKKISNIISRKKIKDIIYFPGYEDYEFTEFVFKELSLKFLNLNFISFLLDEMISFTSHFRYVSIYSDLIISTELTNENHHKSLGTDFIFFFSAFDNIEKYLKEEINKRKQKKQYDIVFIGDVKGKNNRLEFVNTIPRITNNYFIAGPGTKIGKISQLEYFEKIKNSKITINLTGTVSKRESLWVQESECTHLYGANKGRLLQSIFLDSYPLTQNSISAQITFGENLETFNNKNELIVKAEKLLNDEYTRKTKLIALQKIAKRKLLSKTQFNNIFLKLNKINSKNFLSKSNIKKSYDYQIMLSLKLIAILIISIRKINLNLIFSSFKKIININPFFVIFSIFKLIKYKIIIFSK